MNKSDPARKALWVNIVAQIEARLKAMRSDLKAVGAGEDATFRAVNLSRRIDDDVQRLTDARDWVAKHSA